jgi:ATP-binding cassette subfamily B protein
VTNNQNKSLKSYLKEIALEYKIYFISLFVISVVASFFEISVHYKIKEIIDEIGSDVNANVTLLLCLFVMYKFLQHGMFFIARLLAIKYKTTLNTKLTLDIYYKTIKHSLHWFDSRMSGEIADKINGFQSNLNDFITSAFRSLVVLWAIVFGTLFLFKVNLFVGIVQVAFFAIYTPLTCFLLKKQLHLQESFTTASQQTTGVINDSIANIFGIKVVGNIDAESKLKLIPSLFKRQKLEKKTRRFDAFWIDNSDTLMTVIMAAAQIYLMAYLFQSGQITAGGFTFIAMIVLKLHGDIATIIDHVLFGINPQIAKIKASYQFVNENYDVVDKEKSESDVKIKGAIEFRNVSFAYSETSPKILNHFNLKIKAGEKIGLVGQSGAGKTTLIKAILRYFDIKQGDILLDGVSIFDLSQEVLRRNLSVIPQDITMFHRSILENLQIAKYDATEEEIIAACKKAKIHDDILKMKDGYNAIVGERGVKVSGGQRQRIAIARAILKDAPILILDEATSSLDSKTEKQIQASLDVLIEDKSKTVIAIAHRLSTLKHMDRIVVMEEGNIVEEGTHDQLLAKENSLYAKLWELQEI